MKIDMPYGAKFIIDRLESAGFEGYIVGGCVRDAVLGVKPNDWDITTSARPEQVKALFKKTVDTGIQHGTVTVLTDRNKDPENYAYEVTTYRVDGEYEDHRRPKEVTFSSNLEEDLKRRDFTINAMAYNDKQGLVDIFSGQQDLKDHVIRCVGEADERFDEDALRILRAVRFGAKLDFEKKKKTALAVKSHARDLENISAERVREELTKLLVSDHPDRIREAYELGLTAVFLPEFDRCMETEQNNPYHCYTVGEHTIKVLENIEPEVHLRYAALLHDIEKPSVRTTDEKGIDHFYEHAEKSADTAVRVMRRLKFDNKTIARVKQLTYYHDYGIGIQGMPTERQMRRFLQKLGPENAEDFFRVKRADMAGQSKYRREEREVLVNEMERLCREVIRRGDCLTVKNLALNGSDLMAMGIPGGPGIGKALDALLERVIEHPEDNTKEALTAVLREAGFLP